MESNENPAPHHETAAFGSPDLPAEGMGTTTGDPASATMTGPRNPVLESQFPNVITAPATDISTQPFFWSSFNISPRRQQRGGWAPRRCRPAPVCRSGPREPRGRRQFPAARDPGEDQPAMHRQHRLVT